MHIPIEFPLDADHFLRRDRERAAGHFREDEGLATAEASPADAAQYGVAGEKRYVSISS